MHAARTHHNDNTSQAQFLAPEPHHPAGVVSKGVLQARDAIEALSRARRRTSLAIYDEWIAFDVRGLLTVRIRSVEERLPMVARSGLVDDVRRGRYEICRAQIAISRWEEEHARLTLTAAPEPVGTRVRGFMCNVVAAVKG